MSSGLQFSIRIEEKDLPVLSVVATQAMTRLQSSEPTAKELEEIISRDPALTSKILRLANSPLLGGKVKFSTISQAVIRLGTVQLKAAILAAAAGDIFDKTDPVAVALWEHSLAVASASQWLSTRLERQEPEKAMLAGLLHDIGKVLIYAQQPESYGMLLRESAGLGVRFYQQERPYVKVYTHEWVGGMIGRQWGLSAEIVEAIQLHHKIEEEEASSADGKPLVALVSAANLIANQFGFGMEAAGAIDAGASKPARILGLGENVIQECAALLPGILEEQRSLFS